VLRFGVGFSQSHHFIDSNLTDGTIDEACHRYFGISIKAFYKWKRRYDP